MQDFIQRYKLYHAVYERQNGELGFGTYSSYYSMEKALRNAKAISNTYHTEPVSYEKWRSVFQAR